MTALSGAALDEALRDRLEAREGESPGRGLTALELARELGVNVVVVAKALHTLCWCEQLELLHGKPTVVEVPRG